MTRDERLRRVARLCAHFTRNLAYYRGGFPKLTQQTPDLWLTIAGNFLDIATLEWCKLLGDENAKHGWQKTVTDKERFKRELLQHMEMTKDEWNNYVKEMRDYRDKFIAHLDNLLEMKIPVMDRAFKSAQFYYNYIAANEISWDELRDLPADLNFYFVQCHGEAQNNLLKAQK
jgi:hypothetical protein